MSGFRSGNAASRLVGFEVRELPLEGELGDVLVPPRHRFPDAVVACLLIGLRAVHERVGRDLVGGDLGDRLGVGLFQASR